MLELKKNILATVIEHELFLTKQTIIVGVSGGPDSVALLLILKELESDLSARPIAVYVDHKLRPQEARNESELVKKTAALFNIKFFQRTVDVPGYARHNKKSIEEAARELRYRALRELAGQYERSVIAVAHTADDQAEEILLRLLRGSGRKGLSGMLYKNKDIVRPLLGTSKKQLISYLQRRKTAYCLDSSNQDRRYLRNRVRYELLPFLEQGFDQGIRQALLKSASNLADDEELLQNMTDQAWSEVVEVVEHNSSVFASLDRDQFVVKPRSLQRRLVEKLLWRIGSSAGYDHILQVMEAARHGRTGAELHLKKGLRVGIKREFLEFSYPQGKVPWRGSLYNNQDEKG